MDVWRCNIKFIGISLALITPSTLRSSCDTLKNIFNVSELIEIRETCTYKIKNS